MFGGYLFTNPSLADFLDRESFPSLAGFWLAGWLVGCCRVAVASCTTSNGGNIGATNVSPGAR